MDFSATAHRPLPAGRFSPRSPLPAPRSPAPRSPLPAPRIKRLHRTLLLALPLPFVAAFGTLMFLLLMQFLIRYLPELVGRGLPVGAMAELVGYNLAYMVTLAVPMAWLIAQLAAFGRLSESRGYLVARSAGISLVRLAWPVFVVGALLTAAMGVFNNELLPEANYRMNGLWRDIRVSRPGFALTAGTFYTGVDGYAIRADSIPPGDSGVLLGVTVYETRSEGGGDAILTARQARLQSQYGGQRLTMLLEDGEVQPPRRLRPEPLRAPRLRPLPDGARPLEPDGLRAPRQWRRPHGPLHADVRHAVRLGLARPRLGHAARHP